MHLVRMNWAVNWVWHTGDRKRPLNEGQTHTFPRESVTLGTDYAPVSVARGWTPQSTMQRGEKKGERDVGFYQQVLEDAHVQRLLRRGGLLHLEVQRRHDVLDLVPGVNALLDTVEMEQAAESRSIWGESPVVSQAQLTPGSLGSRATYQLELIWGFGPTAHG